VSLIASRRNPLKDLYVKKVFSFRACVGYA
jgi:hypothetical protein